MSAVSELYLSCRVTDVDQSIKRVAATYGFVRLGRVMLSALTLFAAIPTKHALAQTPVAQPTIAPPPGLISAASAPGAFDKVSAMWGHGTNVMVAAYFTQKDLDQLLANKPLIGFRYALILQSRQAGFRFVSEQTFQQIASSTRGQIDSQQLATQAYASFKSQASIAQPGKSASLSLKGEHLLVDESDCLAKVLSSQYKVGDRMLPMDLVTAYVRIDGQLFTIHVAARDDNAADRTWLRDKMMAWIRSLPKAHQ